MSTNININKYVGIGARYIVPPSSTCDADAVTFLSTGGITDATITTAICQLVTDLKAAGVWSKLNAIYPFVGGSPTTNKLNLKNPLTYIITWYGGVTHNSNGVTFNQINSYGDTNYIESSAETFAKTHKAIYDRSTAIDSAIQIGTQSAGGSNQRSFMYTAFGTSFIADCYNGNDNSGRLSGANSGSQGFWLYTRTSQSPGGYSVYKNGVVKATSLFTAGGTQPNTTTWIGGLNFNGTLYGPTSHNLAFASMGADLTSSETSAYYTAVQKFQTTLGRQV